MKRWKWYVVAVLIPFVFVACENEDHSENEGGKAIGEQTYNKTVEEEQNAEHEKLSKVFEEINDAYRLQVKNTIVKKCFNCHGIPEAMPWYYVVPGVKQLIESDMKEAKEYVDMSNDFPFKGRGGPVRHLEELKEVVQGDEMPPFIYRIGHPNSTFTDEEKKALVQWVDMSIKKLGGRYE